jgi:hypothetical protein
VLNFRLQIEGRIVLEDRSFKCAQAGSGLDPKLLGQHRARIPVCLERVRLPSGSIQRNHQLASQPLAEGMRPDQLLDFGNHFGISPECQIGLNALLERDYPELFKSSNRSLGERLVREVCEGRPAP